MGMQECRGVRGKMLTGPLSPGLHLVQLDAQVPQLPGIPGQLANHLPAPYAPCEQEVQRLLFGTGSRGCRA